MKTEGYKCDINKCENAFSYDDEDVIIDYGGYIIFETEQIEGRGCPPYLSHESIDICKTCKIKLLQGRVIFGYGSQGYNTYYFKEQP